ncbi:tubby-related protein 3-like isoform X1 [Centruroides sculpturatus]|uniref:tubby-related protein 3-like isoform X1 n=1 Tax=Centruroides sculpturatus TaxID=218467 RepID=UPI000C6DC1CF|nr:tubby-related protein 3-like isoform X1 [Centruroides sculpturatus]
MMPLMLIMMKQVADQKKGQQNKVKKHTKKTPTSCHPKINYEEEKEDIKPLMADDAVSRISCYDGPFQTTSFSSQDVLENTEDAEVNEIQEKYFEQLNESWTIARTPCLSGTICCTFVSHKKDGNYSLLHSNKEGCKVILLVSKSKTTTTHIISTDPVDMNSSSYAILKSNIFSTNFYLYGSESSSKREELAAFICQTNVLGLRKQRKISVVVPCLPSECQDSSHLINYFDRKKRYGNFKTFILRKTFTESHKQNHFNLNSKNVFSEEKNFVLMDEKSSIRIMNFGRIDENSFNLEYSYPLCAVQAFGIALANVLSN